MKVFKQHEFLVLLLLLSMLLLKMLLQSFPVKFIMAHGCSTTHDNNNNNDYLCVRVFGKIDGDWKLFGISI